MLAAAARAAPITVNTTTDTLTGSQCSLRAAIQAANANAAVAGCAAGSGTDTITLPAGDYKLTIAPSGGDDNASGDLDISSNLTINGAGAAATTVDANGLDRVFSVSAGEIATIAGITITGGHAGTQGIGAVIDQGPDSDGDIGGAGRERRRDPRPRRADFVRGRRDRQPGGRRRQRRQRLGRRHRRRQPPVRDQSVPGRPQHRWSRWCGRLGRRHRRRERIPHARLDAGRHNHAGAAALAETAPMVVPVWRAAAAASSAPTSRTAARPASARVARRRGREWRRDRVERKLRCGERHRLHDLRQPRRRRRRRGHHGSRRRGRERRHRRRRGRRRQRVARRSAAPAAAAARAAGWSVCLRLEAAGQPDRVCDHRQRGRSWRRRRRRK